MYLFALPSHFSLSRRCAIFFVGALTLTRCAHATPVGDPLPGPSGLGVVPTTQTVNPGRVEGSLNFENVDIAGADGRARMLPFANLSYGFKNGEVGASYLHQKTEVAGFSSDTDYFTLHAKYRVYHSGDDRTAIALGAHYYDFGSDAGTSLGNVLSLYATGSYEFRSKTDRPIARVHLGVLGQRGHVPGDTDTFARPFVGIEGLVSRDFSVAADYLAKQGDAAQGYTLSARFQPVDKPLSAQIGIGRLRSDTKFFVGLSYSFGR